MSIAILAEEGTEVIIKDTQDYWTACPLRDKCLLLKE